MFETTGLLVSLPAREMERLSLQSSVFSGTDIAYSKLSEDLRLALRLIEDECSRTNIPVSFIARPEMYIDPDAVAWLAAKLPGVSDHLSLSDGASLRVIPHLRNHIFLYGLGRQSDADSLKRLAKRVPNFLQAFVTQVNTAYRPPLLSGAVAPRSLLLQGDGPKADAKASLIPFYINPNSLDDSVNRMTARSPLDPEQLIDAYRVLYVPLTGTACADSDFMAYLQHLIRESLVTRETVLILGLPSGAGLPPKLEDRVEVVLAGLSQNRGGLPRARTETVFFATADLSEDLLQSLRGQKTLLIHESLPFWRTGQSFYASFESIDLYGPYDASRDMGAFSNLLQAALGREPRRLPTLTPSTAVKHPKIRRVPRSTHRLTIDVTPLFETHWTGIPVFTSRLIRALQKVGKLDLSFAFQLTQIPAELVKSALKLGTGAYMRDRFEREAHSWRVFGKGEGPILYPSVKGDLASFGPEASTVHDISTLSMPETHEAANIDYHLSHLSRELSSNEVTFCVSEATRSALGTAFPASLPKSAVIYQYVDWPDSFEALERNLPPPVPGEYAVVVGTIEPRKNLALLIKALATPELAQSPVTFVVMGRKGWLTDGFLDELTPADRERVLFCGFVSEFTKYRLLKGAKFLIFLSLYEGFGIPALEAMSLGKPVLVARTSSLPEIVGSAGIYFDPLSVADFATAFSEISNLRLSEEYGARALNQNKLFTPERMSSPVSEWISS